MRSTWRRGAVSAIFATILVTIVAPSALPAEPISSAEIPSASEQLRPGGRDVLILLDTSGSMADKESRDIVKITAAKSAIREQMIELPATAGVGLMTYPEINTKSTFAAVCESARLHLPVSTDSLPNLGTALATLAAPQGGTPTAPSLQEASDYLKSQGRTDATIVLISDGESNCGGDPCQMTKTLRAQNVNIAVNTVGFNISSAGKGQLECIAAAGGGQYLDAQDSEQLKTVLKDQLGSGLSLKLTVPSGPLPLKEQLFQVSATVSVTPGHGADDVQVSLRDNDPSSDSYAQKPTASLGNLSPLAPQSIYWNVRPPSNSKLGKSSFQVTVTSRGRHAVSQNFDVLYSHSLASGSTLNGALKDFRNVIVLGDSYSSGEGAGNVERPYFNVGDQNSACHRTKNQYASWLYSPEQVTILACSGAVAQNIYRQPQGEEKSTQLDQLGSLLDRGNRPDAVFVSISGNDIGFSDVARSCFISSVASLALDTDPLGSCSASKKSGDRYEAVQDLLKTVPGLIKRVILATSRVFQDKGVPTPPIIFVQYPNLLGRDAGSPLRCNGIQPVQTLGLSQAYKDFMVLQNALNVAIRQGVREADISVPVTVADTANSIPPGHNLCSNDPWFVPLTGIGVASGSPEMLHPNVEGHQAMAAAINNWAATANFVNFPVTTNLKGEPFWKSATTQWWPTASQISIPLNEKSPVQSVNASYGPVKINVTGGQPFSGAAIYSKSTPQMLGHLELDADGSGTLAIDIQATDLKPGDHTLTVLGTATGGSPALIKAPIKLSQPFPTLFWILIGVALSLGTAALLALRRLRRNQIGS